MKVTGKRSEKILVEELSNIMRSLKYDSSRMEEMLARMRQGKKRTDDYIIVRGDLLIEEIPSTLARIEGNISALITLSPDSKSIPIYQKKLEEWRNEFENLKEQK